MKNLITPFMERWRTSQKASPPADAEKLSVPESLVDLEPEERVSRLDWLRALERLRTDSPVAYETMTEYLKNELATTRRMRMFTCQNPAWFIANAAVWRETKCGVLESQISDMARTVDAINKPPVVEVWDVPPAGVEA